MKVEIYSASSPLELQESVNEFLFEHPNIKVEQLLYSSCASASYIFLFTCMIFYKEKKAKFKIEGEPKKEYKINKNYE